ncbi:helix-turn-helix domain-containing protein [Streptomyces sp. NPDC059783]|uniref:helix-turn-helix domain-containing protein n=1 Tax=Streptomyces sp. NPDC059783 TaxID=3346944 RepID=UPI0036572C50
MTNLDHPVVHVLGAVLRHQRRARHLSPGEAGGLLGVTGTWIDDIETGRRQASGPDLRALCRLYRMGADALLSLADAGRPRSDRDPSRSGNSDGARLDRFPGSVGRLTACMRESHHVRFLSAELIPPPLRPPGPGRRRAPDWPAPRPADVYVLMEGLVRSASPAHVRYLRDLQGRGVTIHVRRPKRPVPQGFVVELAMPGGTVIGCGHRPIAYQPTAELTDLIDSVLNGPGHTHSLPCPLGPAVRRRT